MATIPQFIYSFKAIGLIFAWFYFLLYGSLGLDPSDRHNLFRSKNEKGAAFYKSTTFAGQEFVFELENDEDETRPSFSYHKFSPSILSFDPYKRPDFIPYLFRFAFRARPPDAI
jgi:hypothetical protein